MAFLTLKELGKIYFSETGATVGIRGVNLSFEKGEVVAITGKSGSGKSTLLSVISGMDSYEEGELFIEGESTSHYREADWESYREKYISFIFQDYNIIESFTVLENVELALMNIEDKAERRSRALELIERVGLLSHIRHKGSRLSGGQKQRTVIARALAKNSPIILADEPTGNLDSKTSKEIIELLYEVSRDKLLIIVTHDFAEVEAYATRHIRIFDGAVESDREVRRADVICESEAKEESRPIKSRSRRKTVRDGFVLGKAIFKAKPKLSLFLSLLMIIGALGIFMMSTLCGEATDFLSPHYMFTPIDGRVIVTTRSGEVITEEEAGALTEKYGAAEYLRFDTLLDLSYGVTALIPGNPRDTYLNMQFTYGEDFGKASFGRYPEGAGEVFLYVPISYKNVLGSRELKSDELFYNGIGLKICGVKYYYDNNVTPRCLLTEEGFRTVSALHYMVSSATPSINVTLTAGEESHTISLGSLLPSFDMPADKIYVDSAKFSSLAEELSASGEDFSVSVTLSSAYYDYNYYVGDPTHKLFTSSFSDSDITYEKPQISTENENPRGSGLIMSDELMRRVAESVLDKSYKQLSLFFDTEREAQEAAERLSEDGFIAVSSYTEYEPDPFETIAGTLLSIAVFAAWLVAVIFLAFFISLCSSRVLGAFKSDMAVMRSMGIPVSVIKTGMYVRMLLSLIPSFFAVLTVAALIFISPALNGFFVYMYAWQYALIFIGMIILTVRITHRQIRSLFSESVKKSLRGGESK